MEIKLLVLPPLGTNCYLVKTGENSGVVIDPADKGKDVIAAAAEFGMKIEKILLTHGHFDHTGGVNEIKDATDAKVYIHESDECMLTDGNKALAYFCPSKKFEEKQADVTLKDGDSIEQDGVVFRVMHTPGHSAGSVCFLVETAEENYMFAGDTIFRDSIGRSDGYSGDYIVQKETLEKLKNIEKDYIILSGHGEATTLEEEKRYNPFLR